MIPRKVATEALIPGAIAGLIGGLVFGAAMIQLGFLPTIAAIVRVESPLIGFAVHMTIAAIIGAGFGLLIWRQTSGPGETLFWGATYGVFWWFLGTLTLLPAFLGRPLVADTAAARAEIPALIGHLLYGVATGLALVAIRRRNLPRPRTGSLVRGVTAGAIAAWVMGLALDAQDGGPALHGVIAAGTPVLAWSGVIALGAAAGLAYSLMYPDPPDGPGADLVRGMACGFLWWVVGLLTIIPLAQGDSLDWSQERLQAGFVAFPGFILFLGGGTALIYRWLGGAVHLFFSDDLRRHASDGVGIQGARALGRGAVAGLIGGLGFTAIMVQVGLLSTIGELVGATSSTAGLVVHLLIANVIGASYGVLFRRQSFDSGSAIGWGLSYGVFWSLMGPLTLLPLLLGGSPQWNVEAAAAAFPSLIGHLVYGAALGLTFYWLESRYAPWWMSRSRLEGERALMQREQVLSAAPALWSLIVLIILLIPVLLGGIPAPGQGVYF